MAGRRLPPLNGLRAFEAAARHVSFKEAATELNVTQAAISHQIRSLEDWFGLALFERQVRAVELTSAGAELLPPMSRAFDGMAGAVAGLLKPDNEGELTVSMLASFAAKWLVPRLVDFQTLHPHIDVRISTSVTMADFGRDGVDVALRYGYGRWPNLKSQRLLQEDMFPVCSPRLTEGINALRQPADLARHTLLHVTGFRDDWRVWLTAAGHTEIDADRGPQFDLSLAAVQAAIDGMGVALGHSNLVEADLKAGRLVAPFDLNIPLEAAYYVVAPPDRWDLPKIVAFREWLVREAAKTPDIA
jgi:LysR family glycine cleavage system transcriptional activator